MDIEYYSKNPEDDDNYFLQVRPTMYYNSESLIKRMKNQGCKADEKDIREIFNSLKETVRSILKEGGMVTLEDFISLTPSLLYKSKNKENEIDQNKITLCVKATIPVSFCESIAMEAEINNINKNKEKEV